MSRSAHSSQPPVGIDLGTTYSAVAHVDADGRAVTIPNGLGDLLTPSAILFEDGEVIVGKEAVRGSVLSPVLYADCFKRDIGSAKFRRSLKDLEVPPEVLSGLLLARLRCDAEQRIGPIRQAVITVPAFFDERRRKSTQVAGRLAGLEVLDIINEPTAAALAYAHWRGPERQQTSPGDSPERLLVYDLGGGTFDITLLEIDRHVVRTLATDGDVQLGGKDFDERLVTYLAEAFLAAHGLDPRSSAEDAAQLWLDAQQLKHTLSERTKASTVCSHAGIRMRIELTRGDFERMVRDLLERTRSTTELVMRQAGLKFDELDTVLLVGGSSRMPMVVEMLTALSGKVPDRSQSPDEAVAHGAALHCARQMSQAEGLATDGCELINVNSHSLGVVGRNPRTGRKVNVVLIPKNTPLPHHAERVFRTAEPGQSSVRVPIVEGESERPEACIALGECVIRNLPADISDGAAIHVRFDYSADGTLTVSARLPEARQSTQVEIVRDGLAQIDDLNTWRRRLSGELPSGDSAATVAAGPDATDDPASAVRRLDELYMRLGRAAIKLPLPPELTAALEAARATSDEKHRAEGELAMAEQQMGEAVSPVEKTHAGTAVSRAMALREQSDVRLRFALLALGRACVERGIPLPGTQAITAEIGALRRRLAE